MKKKIDPLRIALIYGAFGILWILVLERLTYVFFPESLGFFGGQILRGIIYASTMAAFVFTLYLRSVRRIDKNRAWYQNLFDHNPNPMWIYDTQTLRFLAVNDAAVHLYGFTRREFLNMTVREIRFSEDVPALVQFLELTPRQQSNRIWRHRLKNGERILAEVSSYGIRFAGRNARMVLAQDVTARLEAEEEARRLSAELATTLESITDAFITMDRDWRFTYVNGMAEKLVQRERADLIGKEVWKEFPATRDSIFEEEYRKAMDTGTTASFDAFYPHPLNAWFAIRAYPSDIGLAVYFRDITKRRKEREALQENQERLSLITRATNDAIWEYDPSTDKIRWSEGFEVRFGYRLTEEESTGKFWEDRVHPEDRDRVVSGIDEAILSSRREWSDEYRFLCRNGEYAHVLDQGHLLWDSEGRFIRMIGGISDFTERARAEQALRESESRFREMADNIADVFYDFDPRTGRMLYVNLSYTRIWGRSRASLYQDARSYIRGVHPEDRRAAWEAHGKSEATAAEYRVVRPDGTLSWVLANSFPITNNGTIERVVGTVRDITEGKRALEALRESERQMTNLLDNLPGMAYRRLPNPEWTTLFTSEGSVALTGFTPEELLDNAVSYGELIHPKDRDRVLAVLLAAVGRDQPFEIEYGIRTRSGEKKRVWERGRFFPGAKEAEEGYVEGFIMDVTARKRAEAERERLTAAIDQLAEVVLITDSKAVIQYVNPAFERVTGYSRGEAVGRNPRLLKSNVHDAAFYSEMWGTLKDGRTWAGRMVNNRKDGTRYTGEIIISPVRDAAGTVVNYVAVQNDISAQLALEDQYRKSQKMEAVGRLAGGVAHDFNNMLTVILVRAELSLRKLSPEDALHSAFTEIREAAERSADLTRQLLTYARRQAVEPRVVWINQIVEASLPLLRRMTGEDIRLMWLPGQDTWPVRIDPVQLDQLLANLCVNARDAIVDTGNIVIETRNIVLDAERCRKHPGCVPGDYVMLAVSDTGSGMDKEVLTHLFEPFFTTKEVGKGTGLGLATVYGIVNQNAGLIEVYSEPGDGTAFRIYLPRHSEPGPDSVVLARQAPGGSGETILLVEDEPLILDVTTQILQEAGYAVLKASRPLQALEIAENHPAHIHLIVTDVVMPEMNGRDLVEKIRRKRPEIKCVFMSGYTANVLMQRGIADQETHFIQKPFTPTDMAIKVRAALDTREGVRPR